MESRADLAVSLFKQGYNCSQSVFAAYSDLYGIDRDLALKIAASFGGGMGRMREICGAFSGILLVAGLETGTTVGKDFEGKKANYDKVQKLAGIYRENNGSIYCKELLGLVPSKNYTDTTPEKRTEEYYKKRPCPELIRQACEIIEAEFLGDK